MLVSESFNNARSESRDVMEAVTAPTSYRWITACKSVHIGNRRVTTIGLRRILMPPRRRFRRDFGEEHETRQATLYPLEPGQVSAFVNRKRRSCKP
jgi:hypothetical protein